MSPRYPYALMSLLLALMIAVAGSPAAAEVVESGTWTKKSFAIAGDWQIVQEGERLFLELGEDFKTRKAPDLKLFLSPKSLAELGNKNAIDGALRLGELPGVRGAQRIALPEDTDLAAYRTLILHCEKYSKLWGGASLQR